MNVTRDKKSRVMSVVAGLWMVVLGTTVWAAEPLKVCATVPDLGQLAEQIGGDAVTITVFTKGTEDPHYLEARPSFIKSLSEADLFIYVGLDLEAGWMPLLVNNARNASILTGATGNLDASRAIKAIKDVKGVIDRSQGDVHPLGNPHYLLDPINGLKVARAIRDRLAAIRPEISDEVNKRYETFKRKIAEALAGKVIAERYDIEKLALLHDAGGLWRFLDAQKQTQHLGGWWGDMKQWKRSTVVSDHNMYAYFAHRFDLRIAGHLEPRPGIGPTTRHLQTVIGMMKEREISAVLSSTYFNARHAQFVSRNTDAKIVEMAHQVGARSKTDDYIAMIDHNIKQLSKALSAD